METEIKQKKTAKESHLYKPSEKLLKTNFAHPSERVCAEILDYYGIRWEYEPRTFPIEFNHRGKVVAYFAPDFYLPDFDLYIELTTMSQKLVTKKNRKIRKLRELFPGINIRIFYQKDFKNLILKYGLYKTRKDLMTQNSSKGKTETKSSENLVHSKQIKSGEF